MTLIILNTPKTGLETLPKRDCAHIEEPPNEPPIEPIAAKAATVDSKPTVNLDDYDASEYERDLPDAKPEEDDGKVCMKPMAKRQPGTPQGELVEYFKAGWSEQYTGSYMDRPVDYVKAAALLKCVDGRLEDAKAAVDRFLADNCHTQNRHPLASILSATQLQKYLGSKPINPIPKRKGIYDRPATAQPVRNDGQYPERLGRLSRL